jgi:hypothetical protein
VKTSDDAGTMLTANGTMDAALIYESPRTYISQLGPEAVFLVAKEYLRE